MKSGTGEVPEYVVRRNLEIGHGHCVLYSTSGRPDASRWEFVACFGSEEEARLNAAAMGFEMQDSPREVKPFVFYRGGDPDRAVLCRRVVEWPVRRI